MATINHMPRHVLAMLKCALAILLLIVISASAQAIELHIDSSASQVRYTPSPFQFCVIDSSGNENCPPPQVPQLFTIAGDIELDVLHEHLEFGSNYPAVDRDLLKLKTSDLSSAALSQGFFLDGASGVLGLMSGETFEVRDNVCFLFVGPGSCTELVNPGAVHTASAGTWDGHTLQWNGFQGSVLEGFDYSIKATVTDVAEPGTVLLLMLALILLNAGKAWKSVPSLGSGPPPLILSPLRSQYWRPLVGLQRYRLH